MVVWDCYLCGELLLSVSTCGSRCWLIYVLFVEVFFSGGFRFWMSMCASYSWVFCVVSCIMFGLSVASSRVWVSLFARFAVTVLRSSLDGVYLVVRGFGFCVGWLFSLVHVCCGFVG